MIKRLISGWNRASAVEAALLLCVFLDLCGFGMILSDVQLRAQQLIPSPMPKGVIIGVILASTFLVQSLVSPLWGRIADRRGRKLVFLGCTALSGLAMVIYGLGDGLVFIALSRIVAGFGGANVAIAQAYISERHEGAQRTASFGRIGAAISLGLIVGPVLGGLLVHAWGSIWMAHAAALSSFAGVALGLIALPADPPTKTAPTAGAETPRRGNLLAQFPKVKPLFLVAVVAWSSLAMLEGTFARLIHALFGYDQLQFGFLFGFEAAVGLLVQTWLLVIITRRFPPKRILIVAYLMQGVGLALNPLAGLVSPPMLLLLVASLLFAVGGSGASPTINSLSTALVTDERHGELLGLLQSARSFGFIAGPALGGAFYDWDPRGPYFFAGLVCVFAACLVGFSRIGAP